jgi:hypothetical protein
MKLINRRTQVVAVVLATLSIVVLMGVPRPYSICLFWAMLSAALLLWFVSLWFRVQQGGHLAEEAKAEAITTAGLAVAFFLVGWLVGFLLEGAAAAWLFGYLAAIAGFIVALAPLRKSPPRPPDSLPSDE